MPEVNIKTLLTAIRDGKLVSRKDLSSRFNVEFRYLQGWIDALEALGLVAVTKKGQVKLHELTEKGEKLLRGS